MVSTVWFSKILISPEKNYFLQWAQLNLHRPQLEVFCVYTYAVVLVVVGVVVVVVGIVEVVVVGVVIVVGVVVGVVGVVVGVGVVGAVQNPPTQSRPSRHPQVSANGAVTSVHLDP